METPKLFWNKRILTWEDSCYNAVQISLYNRLMHTLRSSIKYRLRISYHLMRNKVENKIVLDLGAGSGIFCGMISQHSAKKVIGVDISENAIEKAKLFYPECEFIAADLRNYEIPNSDIVVGLGLMDWLDDSTINKVLNYAKNKKFIFTFSEKRFSIWNLLHHFLIWYKYGINAKVKPVHHSIEQITEFFANNKIKNYEIIRSKRMKFGIIVHNLT